MSPITMFDAEIKVMSLSEKMKDNIVRVISGVVVGTAASTYSAVDTLLIKPRDYEIRIKEQKIEELNRVAGNARKECAKDDTKGSQATTASSGAQSPAVTVRENATNIINYK